MGSGGGSLGKESASNQSQFGQDVWGPQGEALQQMFGQAGNLFGGQNYQNQIAQGQQGSQGALQQMQQPWQQQMGGGAYQDMNLGQNLKSSLDRSMNQPSAMQDINAMIMGGEGNTYADAMKGQYMQDANRAQQQMMGTMDARAAASGMSGGSRHGTAIGQGMEGINRNLQRNLAETGYGTFEKDLERKLGIAQQADQGTLARQQMMGNMLGQQQQTQNLGLQQGGQMFGYGQQQQMMPWQQLGAYAQAIGGPTVLSSGMGSGESKGAGGSFGGKS